MRSPYVEHSYKCVTIYLPSRIKDDRFHVEISYRNNIRRSFLDVIDFEGVDNIAKGVFVVPDKMSPYSILPKDRVLRLLGIVENNYLIVCSYQKDAKNSSTDTFHYLSRISNIYEHMQNYIMLNAEEHDISMAEVTWIYHGKK